MSLFVCCEDWMKKPWKRINQSCSRLYYRLVSHEFQLDYNELVGFASQWSNSVDFYRYLRFHRFLTLYLFICEFAAIEINLRRVAWRIFDNFSLKCVTISRESRWFKRNHKSIWWSAWFYSILCQRSHDIKPYY